MKAIIFSISFLMCFSCARSQLIDWILYVKNMSTISIKNTACVVQLEELSKNTDKEWVLRMFDAWPKVQSGMLEGNLLSLGNFDECVNIRHSFDKVDIFGKYCTLSLAIKTPYTLPKSMGIFDIHQIVPPNFEDNIPLVNSICIPDACKPTDFKVIFDNSPLENQIFLNDYSCQSKRFGVEWDVYDKISIVFFAALSFVIIVSTGYDVYLKKLEKKCQHPTLICFSVYTNAPKLLTYNSYAGNLSCLDGLRVLSLFWIILGHRFAVYKEGPLVINILDISKWVSSRYSQYILSSPLAVDSFLFLSGVLLSYHFMKNQTKPGSTFNVLHFYLHRYVRLTSPLLGLYLFTISLERHINSGPFTQFLQHINRGCTKWWWSIFLYLQNYVNMDEICLIHTWYISMDMQIFFVIPALLIPLKRWPKLTTKILYFLIFIFIFIPLLTNYILNIEAIQGTWYMTHMRVSVFLIGMAFGIYINKRQPFKMNWGINLVIWTTVLCGMNTIIYVGHDVYKSDNKITKAIFDTLHKPAWAVALCWIVVSCLNGYGGVVNWFLSLPIFQVLGRLSYCMYLIHTTIIGFKSSRIRVIEYFSDYETIYNFCGDLLFTIVISFVWVLAFESPIVALEKALLKKRVDVIKENNTNETNKVTQL